MGALGRVVQQEEALLFVPYAYFPIWVILVLSVAGADAAALTTLGLRLTLRIGRSGVEGVGHALPHERINLIGINDTLGRLHRRPTRVGLPLRYSLHRLRSHLRRKERMVAISMATHLPRVGVGTSAGIGGGGRVAVLGLLGFARDFHGQELQAVLEGGGVGIGLEGGG